jgi:UDP-N-acetyl-D-galactosamine dehydrogenase
MIHLEEVRIAVIGLGYVGLPLAAAFGAKYPVTGFDISVARIAELKAGHDSTREVTAEEFAAATQLSFTDDVEDLRACNVYIVTVPTPVDGMKRPDLGPLKRASDTVARVIGAGDVVIYESTVYPGATEEDCLPRIEAATGMTLNRDFFAGYSPERINPGDRAHRIADIRKVTSGSTPEAADFVDALYGTIITAGTFRAASIRVAEAAKVIENTQRDLNIALVNELAMIFGRMELDTRDVIEAAATKWNFQAFTPGLVGGHCIGVDPYYLTWKAQALGYDPRVILAGRQINDGMGAWVAGQLIRRMIDAEMRIKGARVLILGLTFKENVPDLRNTRVIDIVEELRGFGVEVAVTDPLADPQAAREELGLDLVTPEPRAYDALVLAVPHAETVEAGLATLDALLAGPRLILDVKGVLPREAGVIRI